MHPILTSLLVACIPALISLVGVIYTVKSANNQMLIQFRHELEIHNAVQDEKIKELTREVRLHNNYGGRIQTLETKTEVLSTLIEKGASKDE